MKLRIGTQLTLVNGERVTVTDVQNGGNHLRRVYAICGEFSRSEIDAMCDEFFRPGFPILRTAEGWKSKLEGK